MIPGEGVCAAVNGTEILAGNRKLLASHQLTLSLQLEKQVENYLQTGCTIIYIAASQKTVGFLALSDTLRPDALHTIRQVKDTGITPVLLTGDHEQAAYYISGQLDIQETFANCLPEDKLRHIDDYQQNGKQVCMIGDGINDAPALKKAYVGIAMGGVGSDIAVDAADIALVDDEIRELPHLVALSKRMMKTIKLNMTFSMTLNFIAIALAIIGTLDPVVGGVIATVCAVLLFV